MIAHSYSPIQWSCSPSYTRSPQRFPAQSEHLAVTYQVVKVLEPTLDAEKP
eukprot:m.114315 g.114315  ORF g.114315 m.114315 type:complete len:51 (-) comp13049_c0_seq1:118-270(-)